MSTTATPHEGPSTGEPAPPGFQQRLGLFDATMLVAGTMIGSGIFLVSADIARYVGSSGWLMVVWLLTAVMTMMGALCYAELGAMMPQAGGQYVFLREAYSPLWGFLYGWACFLVIQTGSIAAVGVAFATYLGVLVPSLGTGPEAVIFSTPWDIKLTFWLPWLPEALTLFEPKEFKITRGQVVAVAIILFLSLLNCRGVQEGKWVQNLFTVAKTLALILLIILGLTVAVNHEAVQANTSNLWDGISETGPFHDVQQLVPVGAGLVVALVVGASMVGSLFAADAWNNVTFTAGEVKDPRRNLPRSLALGVGLVMVLYLLANLAYMAALPVQGDAKLAAKLEEEVLAARRAGDSARLVELEQQFLVATPSLGIDHARDDRVGTAALQLASPRFGVPFMAVAIMISTFGCVNGMILMGARLYYAMAQDRLFFQSVGRLNRRAVPGAGLILQGIWSALLVFSGTYSQLLDFVIFAVLLFYALTVVGLFILRRRRPDLERPYKAFGYPVIPALYVILCTAIMLDLLVVRPVYTWPGLIIVLSGIPVYFAWRARGAAQGVSESAGTRTGPGTS